MESGWCGTSRRFRGFLFGFKGLGFLRCKVQDSVFVRNPGLRAEAKELGWS